MRRISVTGPESTGKSWLAEQLATHYNDVWVPEYSRKYLAATGGKYGYADILKIARGQLRAEEEAAKRAERWLFCDTDVLVNYIWSTVRFGRVARWIEEKLETHRYDHYLLCAVDLPWEFDPLREHPDRREWLFDLYRTEFEKRKFPYSIVSGVGDERLANAVQALETRFAR